jgi:lysophospholipase L1-like esterase
MKGLMMKYGKALKVCVLTAGMCVSGAGAVPAEDSLCAELKMREGLPNFQEKLRAKPDVRVAYLGGSITMASGWRVGTTAWLQEAFPNTNITEINSAIAGTGAGFGACRLTQHVLKEKPDLIFVEFRVNGGDNSMARTIEGLVRQTWRQLPETDIVFVYTISSPMIADIQNGIIPGPGGQELEQVAAHYGIPSIDFGPEIVSRLDEGSLIFKGTSAEPGVVLFTRDGVHPGGDGHAIYTEIVKRSFETLFDAGSPAGSHSIPVPLQPGNWEQAGMVDPVPYLCGEDGWKTEDWKNSSVVQAFQKLWGAIECERIVPALSEAKTSGAALEFTFEGTVFGFFDIGGPETGSVRITVDDGMPFEVSRFNRFCSRYRPQYYLSEELQGGKHRVRIELAEPSIDKKSIVGAEKVESDARYAGNAFYLVKILLNGKMLD